MQATVKSDFWGNVYNPIDETNTLNDRVRRVFSRPGLRKEKALLNALIGAATGGNATATYARVQANINENGGKRVIETVTELNRNTAAADVTELKAGINFNPVISTPVDGAKRA